MKTLDQVVAETVRKHRGGVEELADFLGKSASYLYRVSNPFDEGAPLPLKYAIPLMEHTKDYSLLKHIALRCGFLCVKIPRVRSAKETEIGLYQKCQVEATQSVIAFFRKEKSVDETLDAIRKELEAAAGFLKAIEAADKPTLDFEEEGANG
jgi:hypothetical protein